MNTDCNTDKSHECSYCEWFGECRTLKAENAVLHEDLKLVRQTLNCSDPKISVVRVAREASKVLQKMCSVISDSRMSYSDLPGLLKAKLEELKELKEARHAAYVAGQGSRYGEIKELKAENAALKSRLTQAEALAKAVFEAVRAMRENSHV